MQPPELRGSNSLIDPLAERVVESTMLNLGYLRTRAPQRDASSVYLPSSVVKKPAFALPSLPEEPPHASRRRPPPHMAKCAHAVLHSPSFEFNHRGQEVHGGTATSSGRGAEPRPATKVVASTALNRTCPWIRIPWVRV